METPRETRVKRIRSARSSVPRGAVGGVREGRKAACGRGLSLRLDQFQPVRPHAATLGGRDLPPGRDYITAFPGEDPDEGAAWLGWLRDQVARRPGLFAAIEENRFQLERRAPLAQNPRLRIVETWPWASVVAWEWNANRTAP